MHLLLLLIIGTFVVKATSIHDASCRVSINFLKGDLSEPQPLILTDTRNPNFVLPSEKAALVIPSNKSILLACPGANNSFVNFESTKIVKATCLSEKKFLIASKVYIFNTFKCKQLPIETIKKSRYPCLDRYQKYEIGFQLENDFLSLYEICRDEVTYRTLYSKHTLVKEIISLQYGNKRPYWKSGPFYPGFEVNKAYTFKSQLQNLGILLGSHELAEKYVFMNKSDSRNPWVMCNRGHLTPKADFVYNAQQATTFWFLNTDPQWGFFNSGHWVELEYKLRKFAATRQLDLIVYTGVHDITTLKDVNGNNKLLYLHVNSTEKLLPVPRFFWKIIHDPISNRATAFIGLNEPYADKITEDMYLCSDIKNNYDFSWLTWKPNDIILGVSYVCTVDSLRKAVSTIPIIGETGLLV